MHKYKEYLTELEQKIEACADSDMYDSYKNEAEEISALASGLQKFLGTCSCEYACGDTFIGELDSDLEHMAGRAAQLAEYAEKCKEEHEANAEENEAHIRRMSCMSRYV